MCANPRLSKNIAVVVYRRALAKAQLPGSFPAVKNGLIKRE
jgi:hypothetical protein